MPGMKEYVRYGAQGICRIEDLRYIKLAGGAGHQYYVLRPLYQPTAEIFVPMDNPKLVSRMRPILSPEEIDQTIQRSADRRMMWIPDHRRRAEVFQGVLARHDTEELLQLARCLYDRTQESGKSLTSRDAQILKEVETIIEREFAFSLHIGGEAVGHYIRKKLRLEA